MKEKPSILQNSILHSSRFYGIPVYRMSEGLDWMPIEKGSATVLINQSAFEVAEPTRPVAFGPCHPPALRSEQPVPQVKHATSHLSKGRVLSASFRRVRRYREFCRVEALVTVVFQYHPALPPRVERLLTSVPILPDGHTNRLRERLIESAISLAVLMHRTDRSKTVWQK